MVKTEKVILYSFVFGRNFTLTWTRNRVGDSGRCITGNQLSLTVSCQHRFVDLDEHPLVVLLEWPGSEAGDAGVAGETAHAAADDACVGNPQHHVDVGVAEANKKLFGGKSEVEIELELRRELYPPRRFLPAASSVPVPVPAVLSSPAAAAYPLVSLPLPVLL